MNSSIMNIHYNVLSTSYLIKYLTKIRGAYKLIKVKSNYSKTLSKPINFQPRHLQRFKFLNILTKRSILRTFSLLLLPIILFNRKYNGVAKVHCIPYKKPLRLEIEDSENGELEFYALWKLILPDLLSLVLAVLCSVAVAIINSQLPNLTGAMLDQVTQMYRTTNVIFSQSLKQLTPKIIRLLLLNGFQAALTFLSISTLTYLGERLSFRLRTALYHSLIQQEISFFDSHKISDLVNRLSVDVQDFKSGFKLVIGQGLRYSIQALGCAFSIFSLSKELSVTITASIIILVIIGSGFGSILRRLSRKSQCESSNLMGHADESLSNIRTVRSLGREKWEEYKYGEELNELFLINNQLGLGIAAFQSLSNFAINCLFLVVLIHGGNLVAENIQNFTSGNLFSVLIATQTLQRSLGSLSIMFGQVIRGWSAGARVFEYIKRETKIPIEGGVHLSDDIIKGRVNFNGVEFSYPNREEQSVLSNLNLELETGKVTALWGPSGAGKSTIAGLLQRFYDPQKGGVFIDGYDLRDIDPTWFRSKILGVISQEPILFATSIKENIRYGRLDATDEEIVQAAKIANAHEFIVSFTKGYDTLLGERGLLISAGQKQRIAIARAVLKNPKILILDEATSALDPKSEQLVQEALKRLSIGRTVLVISHRESITKHADTILLLSHGRILRKGSYEEIMKEMDTYQLREKIT